MCSCCTKRAPEEGSADQAHTGVENKESGGADRWEKIQRWLEMRPPSSRRGHLLTVLMKQEENSEGITIIKCSYV